MTDNNADGVAPVPAPALPPDPAGTGSGVSEDEVDAKLRLVTASYAEALDATKHQDDKIGQLLTSISFLTAAVLALAALDAGNLLSRRFYVLPLTLPLGLITLVVFLVGVAFSVMLLLTSLATPLRLPGLGKARAPSPATWVRDVAGSQMYFFEMARMSARDWEYKWGAPAVELKKERVDSLIKETHNLALRTSAKYDRTTEAVSILSLSLFAFVLATVFVAIVASSPHTHKAVHLTLWQRTAIGGIFACYFWLQLINRIRYNRQAVDETPPRNKNAADRRTYLGELWYSGLAALLIASILIYGGSWPGRTHWVLLTVALALASIVSFWVAAWPGQPTAALDQAANSPARARWQRVPPVNVIQGLIIAGLTATALYGGLSSHYAYQLGAASAAVLGLICASVLQPTLRLRGNRRSYWAAPRPWESPG